jgi:hypothetical protein
MVAFCDTLLDNQSSFGFPKWGRCLRGTWKSLANMADKADFKNPVNYSTTTASGSFRLA